MSLKLGSTTIGSLYLGSTKIGAAYLGNVKVYEVATPPPPGPTYTTFFRIENMQLNTDIARTIDLRSAGMPSTSDLPVVAFEASAHCVSSSRGGTGDDVLATANENIVGVGIQKTNAYSLDYGGTKQNIVETMTTNTSITKMKWIFEYSTTSNQWNYTTYYASVATSENFTAFGSPISIGTNTPFDINRWYSTGSSGRSRITLSNLTAVGFENISDAISWTGDWPIT